MTDPSTPDSPIGTVSPTGTGPFDALLVANRGEIAVRVLRSAAAAGLRTVAVHSDADADAPHVRLADEAVRLGPAPARESYLDAQRVLDAARATGAGAIHPGYGFLSENAGFAAACRDAGIVFVGPSPEAIELMGDKAAAKRRMADAGVPLLAGYQGSDQADEVLLAEAERIGLPLMVKAAAGGGGKGMRLVDRAADLPEALAAARREALAAFGSDVLILEQALLRPRHVEVQVLADAHGHVLAVGERDCSVQRRHQKVIEECPAPDLDEDVREALHAAAVTAAREIGYVGAGTVEFLLATQGPTAGTVAFLEMNTRLQVEHPVTEEVFGIDLVDWQLRIAAGAPLDLAQQDLVPRGHAIEARLYAEDPWAGFLPQVGEVVAFAPHEGPGIRVDAGVAAGQAVTAHYDPMLAKVVAHGRDRDEARRRLAAALDRSVLLGVTTNRTFLSAVLRDEAFAAAEVSTALLAEREVVRRPVTTRDVAVVAAAWHRHRAAAAERRSPGLGGWSNATWLAARQHLAVGEDVHDVVVRGRGGDLEVAVDGHELDVACDGERTFVVDGRRTTLDLVVDGDRALVRLDHADLVVHDLLLTAAGAADERGAGVLLAPMHGAVTSVPVAVGDDVAPGDAVVVLEAMKMEHVVRADVAGTVAQVPTVGAQVADRDVLARIDPGGDHVRS